MLTHFNFKIILLCMLCINFSACGFKLKQEQSFTGNLPSIAIVHKRANPAFINLLEKTLEQRGVRISALSAIDLNILSYQETRHAASVDTTNAQQTETRITKELKYSLSTKKGELIIAPTTLRQSREYINDNRNIGGKVEEERMLKKTLDKEIINLLLRRLESETLHNSFSESEAATKEGSEIKSLTESQNTQQQTPL